MFDNPEKCFKYLNSSNSHYNLTPRRRVLKILIFHAITHATRDAMSELLVIILGNELQHLAKKGSTHVN